MLNKYYFIQSGNEHRGPETDFTFPEEKIFQIYSFFSRIFYPYIVSVVVCPILIFESVNSICYVYQS